MTNILTTAQQALVDAQIPENQYAMASFLGRRMDVRIVRRDEYSPMAAELPFMLVVAEQLDFVIACSATEEGVLERARELGLPVLSRIHCADCGKALSEDEMKYLGHTCNDCETKAHDAYVDAEFGAGICERAKDNGLRFQVGHLTAFAQDDPEFNDEASALAHAKALAAKDWRQIIGIWTGQACGSEPLYVVHDGSVFKRI